MTQAQEEQLLALLDNKKSCSGCKWYFYDIDGNGCKLYEKDNTIQCTRQFSLDFYEPKDKIDGSSFV